MPTVIRDVDTVFDVVSYAILHNDTYCDYDDYDSKNPYVRIDQYNTREDWLRAIEVYTKNGHQGWKAVKMNIPSIQLTIEVKE